MNNITVKDLLNRKLHLEMHLIKEIRERVTAFEKSTGVPICDVSVLVNEIDTTPLDGRKQCIYDMDVEIVLDLKAIE